MPKKLLDKFTVEYLQVLDEKGKADPKLLPKLTKDEIRRMYELMVTTRVFDDKCFKMQRQGRMGTYGVSLGQEAVSIGSALALQKEDWAFPAFREHGVFIARGLPMHQYMQYWGGDEWGAHMPNDVNMFTVAIPVATQIPQGVGHAWAMKMQKKKVVTAIFFGDGATSRGDFHEGMNFAGVYQVPCVFICQNNQWAISLPFERQTHAKTVAQKAIAYGIPGIRVDGNDIFAVYSAVKQAVENARSGKGPMLVECLTYRIGDHTTSDDAKKYRSEEEVKEWQAKDPIARLETYMLSKKIMTKEEKEKLWAEVIAKVEDAANKYLSLSAPNPQDMFKYVYSKMTPELEEQLNEMKDELVEKEEPGDDEDDDKGMAAAW